MLLKPHPNARYRQSVSQLAMIELQTILRAWSVEAEPSCEMLGSEPFLLFDAPQMPSGLWRALSCHSACCLLCEVTQERLLKPLVKEPAFFMPEELPQVLKYKGKTNADFTMMLLNCAIAASDFATASQPLTVLDPVCGKGTTAFCALCLGHHAIGVDRDEKALHEADTYLARSLKLSRFKHKRATGSQTLSGGGHVQTVDFSMARTAEEQKQGDTRTLRLNEWNNCFRKDWKFDCSSHAPYSRGAGAALPCIPLCASTIRPLSQNRAKWKRRHSHPTRTRRGILRTKYPWIRRFFQARDEDIPKTSSL